MKMTSTVPGLTLRKCLFFTDDERRQFKIGRPARYYYDFIKDRYKSSLTKHRGPYFPLYIKNDKLFISTNYSEPKKIYSLPLSYFSAEEKEALKKTISLRILDKMNK